MNRTVQPDHRRHALKVCNRESTCLFSITSCELVFGRQINLPIDLQFGRFGEESGYRDKTEYVARENLKLGSERHKRYYDHKALHRGLKRGDAVWLHNPRRKKGRSPKLQRPWEEPYLVTSRLDDSIYRIQKGPRSKPVIVHVDRLKKYQGKRFINWLSEGKSGKDGVSTAGAVSAGNSTKQQGSKSTPAAEKFKRATNNAEKIQRRPRRATRRPAWTADYHMD